MSSTNKQYYVSLYFIRCSRQQEEHVAVRTDKYVAELTTTDAYLPL